MTLKKRPIYGLLMAAVLAGCSADEGGTAAENGDELVAVRLTASADATAEVSVTRSASDLLSDTKFATDGSDAVHVWLYADYSAARTTATSEADGLYDHATFTTGTVTDGKNALTISGTSGTLGKDKLYYPKGAGYTAHFYAVHPATVATGATSFTVQTNQSSDADYKASDLMYANASNTINGRTDKATPVQLAFAHQLSRIHVTLTSTSAAVTVTGIQLVSVNTAQALTFNQTAMTLTPGGSSDPDDVTMFSGSQALAAAASMHCYAVIPPQVFAVGKQLVKVSYTLDDDSASDDKEAYFHLPWEQEIAAGTQYNLALTLANATVKLSALSIGTWTDSGAATITLDKQ